jgi:hypothetical protein
MSNIFDVSTGKWRALTTNDLAGTGGGTTIDREMISVTYRCKTAFSGASIGDVITCTQVIDVSTSSPSTVATIWRNQTTAADLVSAPSIANLDPFMSSSGTGLTNAELRAVAVPVSVANGSLASRSGTITTGGTAQVLAAANSSRRGFSLLNLSSGDIWINELGTAAASQPSIKIVSGAYFETPAGYGSVGVISVFGATTGQAFSAREW